MLNLLTWSRSSAVGLSTGCFFKQTWTNSTKHAVLELQEQNAQYDLLKIWITVPLRIHVQVTAPQCSSSDELTLAVFFNLPVLWSSKHWRIILGNVVKSTHCIHVEEWWFSLSWKKKLIFWQGMLDNIYSWCLMYNQYYKLTWFWLLNIGVYSLLYFRVRP